MTDNPLETIVSTPAIRILRLNIDKSKKGAGTPPVYTVNFQLSIAPAVSWIKSFDVEWNLFRSGHPATLSGAAIERDFLTIQSALADVSAIYLPNLTDAVARTNEAYVRNLMAEVGSENLPG